MSSQKSLSEFISSKELVFDETYSSIVKLNSKKKILHFLKTGDKPMYIGSYDKTKKVYMTARNRYTKPLSNQIPHLPNWQRKQKAAKLGLRQPEGHYFDKKQAYCLSAANIVDYDDDDMLVIFENRLDENIMRVIGIPIGDIKGMKIIVDHSFGVRDPQIVIPEKKFKVLGTISKDKAIK